MAVIQNRNQAVSQKVWLKIVTAAQYFIVIVLIWNVLRLYPGDSWLPVRLLTYISPWLFMAMVPAALIVMIGGRRWLSVGAGLALLLFVGGFGYLFTNNPQPVSAAPGANLIRAMTYNSHYANRNATSIADMIESQQPDIIAMQEVSQELSSALLPQLAHNYPYNLYNAPQQLLLISRYPLTAIATPEHLWRAMHATLATPTGPVSVWNFHPKPTLKPGRWQMHIDAFTTIAQAIATEQNPQIILGDFNTNDQSDMYRLIAGYLTDAHHAVGEGFGFTFPASGVVRQHAPAIIQPLLVTPAFLRIDHIFVSNHFTPIAIEVLSNSYGSDHRPVVATFETGPVQ